MSEAVFHYTRPLWQVMRDVRLTRPELERLVARRLKTVLVSAYLHVPYYRELMQSIGYDPVRDYRGPEDLAQLPITTRDVYKQREITELVRKGSDLSRCYTKTTSGSTGIPLRLYRSPSEQALMTARWFRVLFLNGYSVRHRVMTLTRPGGFAERDSVVQRFGFLRRLAVDFSQNSDQELVDIFLDYKPDVLYGNRSHLEGVALELGRRDMQPKGLKLLVGTAEIVHRRHQELFRKRFGVELVENYGSAEMGVMAYETPARDGLHLCEDLTYYEFLDEDGAPVAAGEPGRVVVTDLTGKLMPFIRYDQGDLVVFEDAGTPGGTSTRRITQIIGRDSDYVLLPDGSRRVHHDFFMPVLDLDGIAQFRVVQKTRCLFQILIVADSAYFDSIRSTILHRFQREFPPDVSFQINRVDHLELDPSGKLRMLISEVEA